MKRSPNNIGRIKYSLSYETMSHTVVLTILQAKVMSIKLYSTAYILFPFQNLKKADLSGKPDPYVLVNLSNGGIKETKTKTMKNNPNPAWNETFRFNVG